MSHNSKYPDVYIYKQTKCEYASAPFDPDEIYPEFKNFQVFHMQIQSKNENYKSVREILHEMQFDIENYGTELWNPLKNLVKKGQNVVIKPNLVYHEHPLGANNVLSMVTNAAIIRPLIDYILLATEGDVKITIGDAPVQGCEFDKVLELSGVKELVEFYKQRNININVVDFRLLISKRDKNGILALKCKNSSRDLQMYRVVDLKDKSELMPVIEKASRFEITDYGIGAVKKHHNLYKNEYVIPREILEADLFINIPKLKTHRKAGLTCAAKNLVGINGDKTCLAHHTKGTRVHGGDEFSSFNLKTYMRARLWTLLKSNRIGVKVAGIILKFFEKIMWKGKKIKEHHMITRPSVFSEGSWYGNDTIWRCVKDLNKIIFFADKQGKMEKNIQRKYLCIVDAVLAGEGEGPMEQANKTFGVVFGGINPVYIDYAAAKLMRYPYKKIPSIKEGFSNLWWPLVSKDAHDVVIKSNRKIDEISEYFIPTFGWENTLKDNKNF